MAVLVITTDCGGEGGGKDRGFSNLPTGCPSSVGFLAGICLTKIKVPTIPRGWGVVVTND